MHMSTTYDCTILTVFQLPLTMLLRCRWTYNVDQSKVCNY